MDNPFKNLDFTRWYNVMLVFGFLLLMAFGTETFTVIDPQAGAAFSFAMVLVGIGEGANRHKVDDYEYGYTANFDKFTGKFISRIPIIERRLKGKKEVRIWTTAGKVFYLLGSLMAVLGFILLV